MKPIYIIISITFILLLVASNFATYKVTQINNQKALNDIQSELTRISKTYDETKNSNADLKQDIESLEENTKAQEQEIAKNAAIKTEENAKNTELARKVMCLELVKKTPDTGNMKYIGTDIVGYYNDAKDHYEKVHAGEYRGDGGKDDNQGEIDSAISEYKESKLLYDKYMSQCSN